MRYYITETRRETNKTNVSKVIVPEVPLRRQFPSEVSKLIKHFFNHSEPSWVVSGHEEGLGVVPMLRKPTGVHPILGSTQFPVLVSKDISHAEVTFSENHPVSAVVDYLGVGIASQTLVK